MGGNRTAALALLVLLGSFCWAGALTAAEGEGEPSLEEVLEGFDGDGSAADGSSGGEDLDGAPEGRDGDASGDAGALDEILEGFGDAGTAGPAPRTAFESPWWDPDGYFKLGTTYNFAHDAPEPGETDWRGFSRLRAEVLADINPRFGDGWQARIGVKGFYDAIYRLRGRDEFTDQVLDGYEKEVEFREVYLQGRLTDDLDLKAGRQIVVWGKSDNLRVTDVLNPLDMREPGLTDIEDLRLPVAMTRLDYYFGDWSLTGIAIHERRFHKIPRYGIDFSPYAIPTPPDDEPAETLDNTEWALALSGIFSGWDLSLHLADIYDDFGHPVPDGHGGIRLGYNRLTMVGAAYNVALGNWLVKAEAAFLHGYEFLNAPGEEHSRLDVLAGVEYSGWSEATLSLEMVERRRLDFEEAMAQPPDNASEDDFQIALRYTRDFWNDTLTATALILATGRFGDDGTTARFDAEYDVTDRVQVRGGTVLYWSGDIPEDPPMFRDTGGNDRLFLEVEYNF